MLKARSTVPRVLRRSAKADAVRTNSTSAPGRAARAHSSNPRIVDAHERLGALFHATVPLENMANALALVRAIERRYGRVVEHKIVHDSELPQLYRKHLWVTFADQSAKDLLAQNPRLTISATHLEPQPGGPRLSEVAPFLRKAERDEAYQDADTLATAHVIGAEGRPVQPNYTPRMLDYNTPGRERRRQIASSWFAFGGFAPLAPIPAGTPLQTTDQPAKRALFRRAAETFDLENPYEYGPGARPSPPPARGPAPEFRPLAAAPTPLDGLQRPVPTPGSVDGGAEAEAAPLPEVSPDLPSPLPSPAASPEAQAFARQSGSPPPIDPFAAPAPAEESAPSTPPPPMPEAVVAARAVKLPRAKRPIVNAKRAAGLSALPARHQPQAARYNAQSVAKKPRASVAADILSSKPVQRAPERDALSAEHDDSLLAEVRETFFKKEAEEKKPQEKKGSGLFGGWF
ncbi:hypothetical protein HDZ31DRAFT_37329 [Schizophyllum fasciatum]